MALKSKKGGPVQPDISLIENMARPMQMLRHNWLTRRQMSHGRQARTQLVFFRQ